LLTARTTGRLATRSSRQAARVTIDGRELVNFGSNDYLALAADPRLADAAAAAAEQEGWGSGASPLISGHGRSHERLEERLAEFEGTQAALVFSTGFAANAGTIAALVGPGDVVFTDRKNHASLLDGCRLSRADVRVNAHGDYEHLEQSLSKAAKYRRRLIVTDSLFSMDGDLAPLCELADLAERHAAMLMIDEAHATGVFGPLGRGVAEHLGVEERVHVRVGTLSKAIGAMGGYVCGSRDLIEWLYHRGRPFLFSTSHPPSVAATCQAAFALLDSPDGEKLIKKLWANTKYFKRLLKKRGFSTGASETPITPIHVGEAAKAFEFSRKLFEAGVYAPAVGYPTVAEGKARLRAIVTATHKRADLEKAADVLAEVGKNLGIV